MGGEFFGEDIYSVDGDEDGDEEGEVGWGGEVFL